MEDTEVEAAWTFVSSKRNRQPRKQQSKPVTLTDLNVTQPLKGSTADLSLTEIQSDHKKFRQQWLDSDCCHKLRNLLETKSICVTPAKAICLGLGSFDPEDGSWQIRRRSHIQLAAFRTLVDCLEGPSKQPIRCIFQEPCFTSGDKQFLESLGYEIVDSPKGFEEVSDDCLLFGVHLYRDIYSAAIEKATPAIFVGTGYDVWDSYADPKASTWERMKDLHDSCEEVKFPDDKDFYPIFTSTTIHWRKTNSDAIDTLASAVENLSIDKAASD